MLNISPKLFLFIRCSPRWSRLPDGYAFHDQTMQDEFPASPMVSLREYEGTDVTHENLKDRFKGTYDVSVDNVEQCARYNFEYTLQDLCKDYN